MGDAPALRYALEEDAVRARARAMAIWSAVATAMPPVLVVVLVLEMHLAPILYVVPVAVLVVVLAIVRGIVGHRTTMRRLRALVVNVGDDALSIVTARGATRIGREDIDRIVEVTGPLGGLRLELYEREELPQRVDLPRGGARFADLRTSLGAWRPIASPRRRGRVARVAFGVVVVLAIFFLPFFVDDFVARSRVAAGAVILVLWIAMRMAIARR
jgi:hypothetical protein